MIQDRPRHGGGGSPADRPDLPWIRLRLAQAAILWERLWPALWPAVLCAGLFLVIALLDLLPGFPGWLHLVVLLGFAAAVLFLLARGLGRLRLPGLDDAARRLERDGGVAHRPLAVLLDRPAGGADPAGLSLWQAHRARLLRELKRLRLTPPRAGLARRDPFGLRAALILLLVIAGVSAGTDWPGRLADAVRPDVAAWGRGQPTVLDLWITPPTYTGVAPAVLSVGAIAAGEAATAARDPDPADATAPATAQPLSMPEGSRVVAQLQGGRGEAVLVLGDRAVLFAAPEHGSQRAEGQILTGDRLAVLQDDEVIAEWKLAISPDAAPSIAFAEPPAATDRAALRLAYRAADDYGVTALAALIRLAEPSADAPGGNGAAGDDETLTLALPLPGRALEAVEAHSYHDLAPHPWAGRPVEIVLEARDALDQRGRSETVTMVLPEREFHHPVARAIIAERKKLILDPGDRRPVARNLAAIGAIPDAFDNDVVVSLALRAAQRRLFLERAPEAVDEVIALLWDTALRVEDGAVSVAERELRAAQEALQEALAGDASNEEIERLMDELQRALDKFLAALAEQMMQNAQEGELQPMDPNARTVDRNELQEMIERAREMARTGARDAAQEMLAQLQEMLENLKAGMPMMGQGPQGQSEALSMLRDLDALTQRQQELLDRSFRQSQQGQGQQGQGQGQQPGQGQQGQQGQQPGGGQGDAAMQEALRQGLGDLMRRFGEMTGEIPAPLGRAERAMKDAVGALRQGMPGGAVGPQGRALEQLQQAGRAMAESLMQQFGQQPGTGTADQQRGGNRDPLGRNEPGQGMIDTGDVAIPEEAELQRSREILDELQRRAGERERPRFEQDYIERLLRRF